MCEWKVIVFNYSPKSEITVILITTINIIMKIVYNILFKEYASHYVPYDLVPQKI